MSWGVFLPSWGVLGRSWSGLVAVLGWSWGVLGRLGAPWGGLGASWGGLVAVLGPTAPILKEFWGSGCVNQGGPRSLPYNE